MGHQLSDNLSSFTNLLKNQYSLLIDFPGEEPSNQAIEKTFEIIQKFNESKLTPSHISPSVESGIGITFDKFCCFAYLEILNSEEIVFLIDTNGMNMQVWETNFNESEQINFAINKIIKHLNQE